MHKHMLFCFGPSLQVKFSPWVHNCISDMNGQITAKQLTGKVYKLTEDGASTRACIAVLFPGASNGCFTLWAEKET